MSLEEMWFLFSLQSISFSWVYKPPRSNEIVAHLPGNLLMSPPTGSNTANRRKNCTFLLCFQLYKHN